MVPVPFANAFKRLRFFGSPAILDNVSRLTKQEQLVLCLVIGLLLTGWMVKAYRAAHPPAGSREQAKH